MLNLKRLAAVVVVSSVAIIPSDAMIDPVFKKASILDSKNWTAATEGRNSIIMFYAPWCGHCNKMKDSFDGLAEDYKYNFTMIVGKVDCTVNHNRDLCAMYGVKSFPTLKYFSENTGPRGGLYTGKREQWDMFAFLNEELWTECSMTNLDECPEEMQKELRPFTELTDEGRTTKLAELNAEVTAAKTKFRTQIDELQVQYDALIAQKAVEIEAIEVNLRPLRRVIKNLAMEARQAAEAAALKARKEAERAAIIAEEEGSCSMEGEGTGCEDDEDDEDE